MKTEAKTPALARAALQNSISSILVTQQNMYATMNYDAYMKGDEIVKNHENSFKPKWWTIVSHRRISNH
jgi:spore coat protein CotF